MPIVRSRVVDDNASLRRCPSRTLLLQKCRFELSRCRDVWNALKRIVSSRRSPSRADTRNVPRRARLDRSG